MTELSRPLTPERHWTTYAGRSATGYKNFGHVRYVQMCGHKEVIEVELIEDPEGTYWGWIKYADLLGPLDPNPRMVQPSKVLFDMQFPYGPESEAARGKGEVVRLCVREIGVVR
jgi:hypothetical protein